MKVLAAAILMFVSAGIVARAQTPQPATQPDIQPVRQTAPQQIVQPKIVAEIASAGRSVKNSPFTADAISESVQTLADGNRIVRSSTSKLYRNSEGRFRQEFISGTGGALGSSFYFGDGVTVFNPGQSRFYLDSQAKIARVYDEIATAPLAAVRAIEPVRAIEMSELSPEARREIEKAKAELDKVRASSDEIKAAAAEMKAAAAQMATTVVASAPAMNGVAWASPRNSKWETRTEDLGEQNYEGVSARGTRTTTIIPAGEIGNERQIEIVYEKWFSNELQMVVFSKQSDPRSGEQTYRLTNINRNEPDPSLFQVPSGYKVVSDGRGTTYTTSSGQGVSYSKGTSSSQGGTVTRTKNQN